MKKAFIYTFLLISYFGYSQTIIGNWETYDDKTNEKKSVVEIFKDGEAYFGKIKEVFVKKDQKICVPCPGNKKNQPIIGLTIIEKVKKDGDEYNNGTILDPENGNEYSCILKLESNNKLKVRGYIGFSLLGRTQYWLRKK